MASVNREHAQSCVALREFYRRRYAHDLSWHISRFLYEIGGRWLMWKTFRLRQKLGWYYWKLSGRTCSWNPNADLNDLLDQIGKQMKELTARKEALLCPK